MNQTAVFNQNYLIKIEQLEKELVKLKKGKGYNIFKKPFSFKGVLKGVKVSLNDIESAKKSLFKE
ncbi:hypothetical protein A2954_05330 [Candidatus Roizmanbacteria bacterium RIFCSPLOWO2_01_FULL_37_12]|uniref:Uncharacterized protein n=1 Tax=Candidatus Roizmanbacteria bacterium RIFCSPLOWO2_01_FULL_37_12 TaxID=1802056 RepID=A0A1F7IDG1_9BACT|nr:MAG: hypothetical protein A2768_00175 [Candidatus Roizmanbacteria bacterium RIFCSPHIGHO2_01_FULL_37_16]OGK41381.1 MAG: hypothetical protein A2954_05330 [Candidatus Roizmanbacteria bacterium RIFCSPLOWO2_01_FULL_37_12]